MKKKFMHAFYAIIFAAIVFNTYGCARPEIEDDFDDASLPLIQDKSFTIEPGKMLEIAGDCGSVNIRGWGKNEVSIKVYGNDNARKKITLTFKNNGDRIEVKAEKENGFFTSFKNLQLRFEVMVPAQFNGDIRTSGGNIKWEGVTGDFKMKTSGGDINTFNCKGNFQATTSGGNINFNTISGNMDFKTSGGEVHGEDFKGDLNVSTSGGNISLNGVDSKIDASTSGGDINLTYSGENRGIELYTSGGNIEMRLPSNLGASVTLSTSGGSISSDFSANNITEISSKKFEADINEGGNLISAKTSGGDIRLSKK